MRPISCLHSTRKVPTVLIRQLAHTRTASATQPHVRYSPTEKIAYVEEAGVWLPSTKSSAVTRTKKADLETGEDQKGQ